MKAQFWSSGRSSGRIERFDFRVLAELKIERFVSGFCVSKNEHHIHGNIVPTYHFFPVQILKHGVAKRMKILMTLLSLEFVARVLEAGPLRRSEMKRYSH